MWVIITQDKKKIHLHVGVCEIFITPPHIWLWKYEVNIWDYVGRRVQEIIKLCLK
jgi:hypothetical protein